jgi:hypothetical protein
LIVKNCWRNRRRATLTILSIAGQALSNSVFHKGHVLRKPATV